MSEVEIGEIVAVDDELMEAFERLVPQLSSSSPPPSRTNLEDMVANPRTTLFAARVDGRVIGSLTLAFVRIPTGLKAWVEDVVVDSEARGMGVGEALCRAALDRARAAGAKSVELTSNPTREAANRLYRRLGFEQRVTNVYRYKL